MKCLSFWLLAFLAIIMHCIEHYEQTINCCITRHSVLLNAVVNALLMLIIEFSC